MLRSLRTGPVLAVLAAVAIFSVGGAAFSAANTVPTSSVGEGSGTISGYTITAVVYTLNGTDRSNIDTLTFTATADNGSTAIAARPRLLRQSMVSSGVVNEIQSGRAERARLRQSASRAHHGKHQESAPRFLP